MFQKPIKKTWQKLRNNPNLFNRYFVKEYFLKAIRKFFEKKGYHELDCPVIVSALPTERYVEVIPVKINLKNRAKKNFFLIPSTETFNKKILAAGLGNHFVISKVFRGCEQISPNHSPEFTMLEWYSIGKNYIDLMDETKKLILFSKKFIDKKLGSKNSNSVSVSGKTVNLTGNWFKFSVEELLKKHAGIDLKKVLKFKDFAKVVTKKGYKINKEYDWQCLYELIFSDEIFPKINFSKPVFIYDYPSIICPLTKRKKDKPYLSERFELFFNEKEVANGYSELLDHKILKKNFEEEFSARKKLHKIEVPIDYDLINAIRSGIKTVAGIGMGIDRMAMIFAGAKNISEINYFPFDENY